MGNSGNRAESTRGDSGEGLMTGVLTAHPHLRRWGGGTVAAIRQQHQPSLEINQNPQNLRHKSHSQPPASPNKRASTGIITGFCR
jgi:hypothetical protein